MTHWLFTPKRALDEVNRQLMEPTEDPRAEASTYLNPWFGKGTEYDPNKTSAAPGYLDVARKLVEGFGMLARRAPEGSQLQIFASAAGPDLDRFVRDEKRRLQRTSGLKLAQDYLVLADVMVHGLDVLARKAPKGGNIQVFAEEARHDMREFIAELRAGKQPETKPSPVSVEQEMVTASLRGRIKLSEIEMHRSPKFLPPRHDVRSLVDDDIKQEMEDENEPVKPRARRNRVTVGSSPRPMVMLGMTFDGIRFTWNPAKDAANQRKHFFDKAKTKPISFELAKPVFSDARMQYREDKTEPGRLNAIGMAQGVILFVVFESDDENHVHIISARRASKTERKTIYG